MKSQHVSDNYLTVETGPDLLHHFLLMKKQQIE